MSAGCAVITRALLADSTEFFPEADEPPSPTESEKPPEGYWFTNGAIRFYYPFEGDWLAKPVDFRKSLGVPASPAAIPHGMGLRNRSNACFLNSVIQALTYCPPLYHDSRAGRHRKRCTRAANELDCGFCSFEDHIRNVTACKKGTLSICFYEKLKKESMRQMGVTIHDQQCAHEFFGLFLDWLRRYDLPKEWEAPFLKHSIKPAQLLTTYLGQVFGSVVEHTRVCLGCNDRSVRHETYSDHVLSIQNAKGIADAVRAYFKSERLDGSNATDCDTCGKKQPKLWKRRLAIPPNILVLTVRRTVWSQGGHLHKDKRVLQIPLNFDVSPYLSHHDEGDGPRGLDLGYGSIPNMYRLYASIVHQGGGCGGHYYALCRATDGSFYRYDDECVTQVRQADISTELGRGYIFFFERMGGAVPKPQSPPTMAQYSTAGPIKDTGAKPLSLAAFLKMPLPKLTLSGVQPEIDSDAPTQTPSSASAASSVGEESPQSTTSASSGQFSGQVPTRHRGFRLERLREWTRRLRHMERRYEDLSSNNVSLEDRRDPSLVGVSALEQLRVKLAQAAAGKAAPDELGPGWNRRSETDREYDRGRLKKRRVID